MGSGVSKCYHSIKKSFKKEFVCKGQTIHIRLPIQPAAPHCSWKVNEVGLFRRRLSPLRCPWHAPRRLAPSPWLTHRRCAGAPSSPAREEQTERPWREMARGNRAACQSTLGPKRSCIWEALSPMQMGSSRSLVLSHTRLTRGRKGTTCWVKTGGGNKLSRLLVSQTKNQLRTSMSFRLWKFYLNRVRTLI